MSYRKAMIFAEKHLGPTDSITTNLKSVYQTACSEVVFVYIIVRIAKAKREEYRGEKGR